MFKVHCLNNISKVGLSHLSGDFQLTDNIDEADAILVRSANMHDMEFSSNLKCVARAGAGVNNIPLEKLAEKNIPVFNTPGANANAVKELVIAGLLLSCRDIVGGCNWVCDNQTDPDIAKSTEKAKKAFAGREISGKTLGVIGLGAIGKLVVNAAESLGMKCVGYDPFLNEHQAALISDNLVFYENVTDVYDQSDFITIHVPATKDTTGMINSESFRYMKEGVVFLNFSRDKLVNEVDMSEALRLGKVAKYVTDFPNSAVVNMDNTIVLPHLGASTEEAEDNCATMAVQEIMDYLCNGIKNHCVNL